MYLWQIKAQFVTIPRALYRDNGYLFPIRVPPIYIYIYGAGQSIPAAAKYLSRKFRNDCFAHCIIFPPSLSWLRYMLFVVTKVLCVESFSLNKRSFGFYKKKNYRTWLRGAGPFFSLRSSFSLISFHEARLCPPHLPRPPRLWLDERELQPKQIRSITVGLLGFGKD